MKVEEMVLKLGVVLHKMLCQTLGLPTHAGYFFEIFTF